MTFADIALPLAERGFRVFPLVPQQKFPVKMSWGDHFDAATTERADLEKWDKEVPRANVGISPDENFCFLETDSETELKEMCADLPLEIWDTTRHSSGRPDRACYYFRQTMRTRRAGNMTLTREGKDNLFEFKQHRCLVVGPGSIHPLTGKPYGVEWRTIPAMPDVLLNRLCELKGAPKATDCNVMSEDAKRETATLDRFLATYEVTTLGDWFNKGKSWYRPIECPWLNEHENDNQGTSTCIVYTEGSGYGFDCKHRCANKGWQEFKAELVARFPDKPKFRFVEPAAEVTIGGVVPVSDAELAEAMAEQPPKDWRSRYLTFEQVRDAKPVEFLIEGFLALDSITAIAAPVGQRKSLIALNVAHALCTGKPLFDYFKVAKQPSRVVYLCPEMGISSFSMRLKQIGLASHVGQTLFCQTMDVDSIKLTDLDEELPGAVVIVDTLTRFVEGDQNSSEDMSKFAKVVFKLQRGGATVVLLHHSIKGTSNSSGLTLDSAMRGSTELAAFVTCCWATRLTDPDEPYKSPSLLVNVKQRDFESKPFEAMSDATCRMHIIGEPGQIAEIKSKADDEAKAALALILKESPKMGITKLRAALKTAGHPKGQKWVTKERTAILGTGVTSSA
jgi:hypothetical protein